MDPNTTVHVDDKYRLRQGRAYMTGIQALVRLPMMQRRRDLASGLNTGGYISGYRGSPLGALDQQLKQAETWLNEHEVVVQPGVNEDLAATALWGAQQAELSGSGRFDGVLGMWYGKGPGVDRCGHAFRHANLAGTSRRGGVLALLGDDHTCESSTTAHQSEFAMVDAMVPVLNPAGVQEFLDYGILGWALSRYAGCWVALKCIHDTVESAASVCVDDDRVQVRIPSAAEHALPDGGLNIRWPDSSLAQEQRLHEYKLEAVKAFARLNELDRTIYRERNARIGIVTTGKSYLDVLQALDELAIDANSAAHLGLGLYKVALSYPLEPHGIGEFSAGLEQLIVVEEKRGLIESQLKSLLYGVDSAPQSIIGKHNESGAPLFPSAGRLNSNQIAIAIGERLSGVDASGALASRVDQLRGVNQAKLVSASLLRTPYFCPGCPHNTSTRVPEGSHALAGIGCHYLAQFMDRSTARFTQMGAEGASWIGEAPFSTRAHVFQNIGDGTYYHSGLLAIRAAIAAGVNVTYKILFNDAVAMTGGQPVDGPLSVAKITQQVRGEGVERIAVVTDEPEKYLDRTQFAKDTTVDHRDRLDLVQRELREIAGATVIIYDQTCAAEKRRRRKRGQYPDPDRRLVINEWVCEGCGDCGEQSNCVAIVPLETDFGRKRAINQSACNKDFSCLNGFCPSFVSIEGGRLRKGHAGLAEVAIPELPEPVQPTLDQPYNIVIAGVGGTGIVTVGALLGMAAHIEGKGCSVLDMMGLAQKGGSVISHLRIGANPAAISTTRIAAGAADLLLGCDLLVAASVDARETLGLGCSRIVVDNEAVMTGDFTRQPDLDFPVDELLTLLHEAVGRSECVDVSATRVATALLGDTMATNIFLLGLALQQGKIPVSAGALEQAITLNGVAVDNNLKALRWGRWAGQDWTQVEKIAYPKPPRPIHELTLDERIAQRAQFLREYQGNKLATHYQRFVASVRESEQQCVSGASQLSSAVARYYFKLLAYKDEYEVARLQTLSEFDDRLAERFEGDFTVRYYFAPSWLTRADRRTGQIKKREFGPWVKPLLRVLARLKFLRGSRFDPFGYARERRIERRLIVDYRRTIEEVLEALTEDNYDRAVELATLPEQIRGYGHIKLASIEAAEQQRQEWLKDLRQSSSTVRDAAA